jgi:hypothetical protein
MLTSTAERDRAVDALRAAYFEGRLTQEEFTERVAQVHASRTFDQLAELLCDLPAAYPPASYPAADSPEPRRPFWREASATGLTLTSLIIFGLAALATAVALFMHAHPVQMSPAVDQCQEPGASHLALARASQVSLLPCVVPQSTHP